MTAMSPSSEQRQPHRHRPVALACAGLVTGMVAMSYAAVPLYKLYCQATGYNGTTQRASKPSEQTLDRMMSVRFDANVGAGLAWHFEPLQRTLDVKIGENVLAFYRATNSSSRPLTGMATFNVTPELAGSYFAKVECFCFTEQRLEPGQSIDMPVSFYIDPALIRDSDAAGLQLITLSYTFFPVAEKATSAAAPIGKGS